MAATLVRRRAVPISLHEYSEALSLLCYQSRPQRNAQRIALAISGGVDSMALAHLSIALQHKNPHIYEFTALVVDHKARTDSSNEALRTCIALQQLGLQTELLSISWNDIDPATLPNFESIARKHRYAMLSEECRRLRIDKLFTAHHLDDQAETILMRLTQGYTGYGLGGIQRENIMPEPPKNYSGLLNLHASESKYLQYVMTQFQHKRRTSFAGIISSNIRIGRPLLGFAKDRLISTCEDSDVPWIEDSTNTDKTLTPRNAVRHLLAGKAMPKALCKESLLRLGSNVSNARQYLHEVACIAFEKIIALKLDPRTGILTFTPPRDIEISHSRAKPYAHSKAFLLKAAMALIKMIADIVTPQENLQVERFANISKLIFPQYSESNSSNAQTPEYTERRINAGGILWEQLPIEAQGSATMWRLSRQLPNASDRLTHCRWVVENAHPARWQPWKLFDGRFWIRVKHPSKVDGQIITARRFMQEDMARLRSVLPSKTRRFLDQTLKAAAPGVLRWTLPVLVDDDDTPIALPTMGLHAFQRDLQLTSQFAYREIKLPKIHMAIPAR